MSKPVILSQVKITDDTESAPRLHPLQGSDGRLSSLGTKGALISGGPSISGLQLKSSAASSGSITADQLVGGQISLADGAGAPVVTLPGAAAIFEYLSRQNFRAASDPSSNIGATTAIGDASVPIQSFEVSVTTGLGAAVFLDYSASGLSFYPNGLANAGFGAGTVELPTSSVSIFRFVPVDYTNANTPSIAFYPIGGPLASAVGLQRYGMAAAAGGQTITNGAVLPAVLDTVIFNVGNVVNTGLDQMRLLANSVYQVNVTLRWTLTAPAVGAGPSDNRIIWDNGAENVQASDGVVIEGGETGGSSQMCALIQTDASGGQFCYVQCRPPASWGAGQAMRVDTYQISVYRLGSA